MPQSAREHEFVYNWNRIKKVAPLSPKPFELYDETLRDGIQSPSVTDPTTEEKIELISKEHKIQMFGYEDPFISYRNKKPHYMMESYAAALTHGNTENKNTQPSNLGFGTVDPGFCF